MATMTGASVFPPDIDKLGVTPSGYGPNPFVPGPDGTTHEAIHATLKSAVQSLEEYVTGPGAGGVIATGGTTYISFADRFGSILNAYDLGASGTGLTDDSLAIEALLNEGGDLYLREGIYLIESAITITGKTFSLTGDRGAILKFTSAGSITFESCTDSTIRGVTIQGFMTSATQYTVAVNGVQSYINGSQTYNNGTSNIDGSDFTHTFSTPTLTLSLLELASMSAMTRNVVTDYIPLVSADRYVIQLLDGYYSGDGCNTPIFSYYDAGKNLLGTFDPQSSDTFSLFTGASFLTVSVGVYSQANTTQNQTCTVDLSKVQVLRLINDAATISTVSPPENSTHIAWVSCTNCVMDDNQFQFVEWACVKFESCTTCAAVNNRSQFCIGGITSQTSMGTVLSYNRLDMRLLGDGGVLLDNLFARTHGLSAFGDSGLSCCYNSIWGAEWSIEVVPSSASLSHVIAHNTLDAPFVGISSTTGFDNQITHNSIKIGNMGLIGVEVAGNPESDVNTACTHNSIMFRNLFLPGFGVSCPNVDNLTISFNKIKAPLGIFGTNESGGGSGHGLGPVIATNNRIEWSFSAVYLQYPNVIIRDNVCNIIYSTHNFVGVINGAIIIENGGTDFSVIENNYTDGTDCYDIYINQHCNVLVQGNVVNGMYSKPYSMVYGVNPAVATIARFFRNTLLNYQSTLGGPARWLVPSGTPFTGSEWYSNGNIVNESNSYNALNAGALPTQLANDCLGAVSWTPGVVTAGSTVTNTVSVPGAGFGDVASPFASYDMQGCIVNAYVSSAGICTIAIFNPTGGTITFTAGTWGAIVNKQ